MTLFRKNMPLYFLAFCLTFGLVPNLISARLQDSKSPKKSEQKSSKSSKDKKEAKKTAENTQQADDKKLVQWASDVISFTSQLRQRGPYSAAQLVGKPNLGSMKGESNPCSWAAATDGQQAMPNAVEKVRVAFEKPVFARQVAVAENNAPGAVGEIIVWGEKGEHDTVYKAKVSATPERFRVLNAFFSPRPYKVKEVELIIHTGEVPGWNEINAIAMSNSNDTVRAEINLSPNAIFDTTPENLGARINSEYQEVLPVISPDGKTLYVCRRNHPKNIGGQREDIWFSELQTDGFWGELKNIGRPLNNRHSNFVCSVTPDGNTMLLGGAYISADEVGPGLSLTHRTADGWEFPKPLTIDNFYNRGQYVNYFLAADGKTLLLALERDDTEGNMDMYVSFLQENGNWSEPKNLGRNVNTAGQEATIFLASDNRTLYFSSEGHNGYGRNDIFLSRRLDESWTNWSEPENLGPSINTENWDAYFTLPASGEFAYFVSTNNSFGNEDIFRIALPASLRPRPVALVSGKALNAKNDAPLEAAIRYEDLKTGKELGIARTDPRTGEYKIVLPTGENYGFRAEAKGFIPVNQNLDLRKLGEYKEITQNLKLVPIEQGQTVRLNNIFFETGKWELESESSSELLRVVELLKTNPAMSIVIYGHTDNVGVPAENVILSQKRAKSVSDFLVSKGIDQKRLEIKGLGQTKPEASNATEEGRQQNRRVEFKIEKQ